MKIRGGFKWPLSCRKIRHGSIGLKKVEEIREVGREKKREKKKLK